MTNRIRSLDWRNQMIALIARATDASALGTNLVFRLT